MIRSRWWLIGIAGLIAIVSAVWFVIAHREPALKTGAIVIVIALVHWQAWDDATRDVWDQLWEEACEREPAGRS